MLYDLTEVMLPTHDPQLFHPAVSLRDMIATNCFSRYLILELSYISVFFLGENSDRHFLLGSSSRLYCSH